MQQKKGIARRAIPFPYRPYRKLFGGNFGGFHHYGVGGNAFFHNYYFFGSHSFFFSSASSGGLVAFATYESNRNQSAQKDDSFHDALFL